MTEPQLPDRIRGEPEQMARIYLTVGVRTNAGPGPGVKQLPASEANALIGMKYAVYGDREPGPEPEPVVRAFPHVPLRRSASSN